MVPDTRLTADRPVGTHAPVLLPGDPVVHVRFNNGGWVEVGTSVVISFDGETKTVIVEPDIKQPSNVPFEVEFKWRCVPKSKKTAQWKQDPRQRFKPR